MKTDQTNWRLHTFLLQEKYATFFSFHYEERGWFLEAELPKEQFVKLGIAKGDTLYVRPKQLKVFVPEDFSI